VGLTNGFSPMKRNLIPLICGLTEMFASAICFLMYMANGIVSGSLVGRRGREHDLQIASIRASWAIVFALGLQIVAILMTMLFLTRYHSQTSSFKLNRRFVAFCLLPISLAVSILGTDLILGLVLMISKPTGSFL
jgi:hypothetical protein